MSDKELGTEAELQKIVITPEDCNAALDFWRHFNIPIPSYLQEAFDGFSKDPSFDNQEVMKLALCKAISETDHEAFKDEMFGQIVTETSSVTFEMQFDQDFEETVSTDDK